MTDWADEIEREIETEMNNSDQCEHFIALPHGRVAAALRKAKAEGVREAANRLHELTGRADGARLWDLSVSLKDRANAIYEKLREALAAEE